MNKLSFLLFSLVILLVSCKENIVEEIIEKFPDSTTKLMRTFKVGGQVKELVKEIKYYPNHKKYYEGEFKDNRKDGKWTVWYDNGNVWSEGYFSKGQDDGIRTGYYENGQKHFQGKYTKGKMTGTWKFWDEKGKLAQEIDYDKKK